MISLDHGKTVEIVHDVVSPAVYLDQAPLLNIARNQGYANRFLSALERRNGTLVFSWLNAVELADPEDPKTFASGKALFEKAFPRIAFQEAIPDLVVQAEDADDGKWKISRPQLDRMMFGKYTSWAAARKTMNPIDPAGFLDFARECRDQIRTAWSVSADRALKVLESARASGNYPEPDLAGAEKRARPTRHFDQLALHHLVNSNLPLTSQNYRDYHHMVVAVSYCDYVVLDKHWTEQAGKFQRRLEKERLLSHTARVFRVGELEGFLFAFESEDYLLPTFSSEPRAKDEADSC